jgi:hypothetical protein
VPPVIASNAAASRRADGEAAGSAYRILHASRIASSISSSVTLITSNRFSGILHIPELHYRTRPELTKCAGSTHKPKNNNHNMFIDRDAITYARIMLENRENLLKSAFFCNRLF